MTQPHDLPQNLHHAGEELQFSVDSYEDEAIGVMTANERGTPWVSAITLRPKIRYIGSKQPDTAEAARLHHEAHEQCYISQSIKIEVTVRERLQKGSD